MTHETFRDSLLGSVEVRRSKVSSSVRVGISLDGSLRVTAPTYVTLAEIKKMLMRDAPTLERLRKSQSAQPYIDNQQVTDSISIRTVISTIPNQKHVQLINSTIVVTLMPDQSILDPHIQNAIRATLKKVYKKLAQQQLPTRIAELSHRTGLYYNKLRFPHTSSRWGSCSSSGTISLNIALMKLPIELIDYVLIHELCHTQEMNHSKRFWNLVATHDPAVALHKKQIKLYNPSI